MRGLGFHDPQIRWMIVMTTHLVNMKATMMTKALTRVRMLAFNITYVIVYSVSHSHECSLHIFLLAAVFHVLLVCVCVCVWCNWKCMLLHLIY